MASMKRCICRAISPLLSVLSALRIFISTTEGHERRAIEDLGCAAIYVFPPAQVQGKAKKHKPVANTMLIEAQLLSAW